MNIKLLFLGLALYLVPGHSSAACEYPEGPNNWGWDEDTGQSCEPLNIGIGNPGVRVSWQAIPQATQIPITYIVEIDIGGGMVEAGRTQGVEYFTTYDKLGASGSVRICARITATDYAGNQSDPSPEACVYASQIISLDTPQNVNIIRE